MSTLERLRNSKPLTRAELRQCIKEAHAHVVRQEFAGKHEQDRLDAIAWLKKWRDRVKYY
jgi:hypothetical protein